MNRPDRRFRKSEVKSGPFKGSLHIAPNRYVNFVGEINLLHAYLAHRLLPTDPEDITLQGILVLLQNLLEHKFRDFDHRLCQEEGNAKGKGFSSSNRNRICHL